MEFFSSTTLTIPLIQVMLLLALSTLSLLFGKIKFALMINYSFVFFWGYIFNRELLAGDGAQTSYYIYVYFGFGLVIAIFSLFGFLVHQD